jgi:hypothetical protein
MQGMRKVHSQTPATVDKTGASGPGSATIANPALSAWPPVTDRAGCGYAPSRRLEETSHHHARPFLSSLFEPDVITATVFGIAFAFVSGATKLRDFVSGTGRCSIRLGCAPHNRRSTTSST